MMMMTMPLMMKGEYIDLVAHVYMEGSNGNQNHCVGTSRDLSVILIIRAGKIDLMMMMMMMMMVMGKIMIVTIIASSLMEMVMML